MKRLLEILAVLVVATTFAMAQTSSSGSSTSGHAGSGTAFSQAFVEAVGGNADEDGDGVVQFVELSRYLSTRVRELSGGKQSTAIERPNGVGSFPIAEPGNR